MASILDCPGHRWSSCVVQTSRIPRRFAIGEGDGNCNLTWPLCATHVRSRRRGAGHELELTPNCLVVEPARRTRSGFDAIPTKSPPESVRRAVIAAGRALSLVPVATREVGCPFANPLCSSAPRRRRRRVR